MAGHWPLPLLGKLCLCPWGLQICATPEPQLQLWAQAGAKSLHLILTFTTSTSILHCLSSILAGHFLPPLHLCLSGSLSACLSPPVTPFYLLPVHPLCCLTGTSSAWGLLGVHRKFSGHPPISIHPFSRHLCVFTSPSLHVRQTTAAAIACLPFWTAWLCFQFPQGRLQRR